MHDSRLQPKTRVLMMPRDYVNVDSENKPCPVTRRETGDGVEEH